MIFQLYPLYVHEDKCGSADYSTLAYVDFALFAMLDITV